MRASGCPAACLTSWPFSCEAGRNNPPRCRLVTSCGKATSLIYAFLDPTRVSGFARKGAFTRANGGAGYSPGIVVCSTRRALGLCLVVWAAKPIFAARETIGKQWRFSFRLAKEYFNAGCAHKRMSLSRMLSWEAADDRGRKHTAHRSQPKRFHCTRS
jgi:hypothetical protein